VLRKNILLEKITKHVDYAQMRRGHIISTSGFILQGRARDSDSLVNPNVARYGLTCSKRIGNAVKRNRAKRRLRSLVANILPRSGLAGWDYVLIGKINSTESLTFDTLKETLSIALEKMHNRGK
tara:strand:- start:393 stop:764 length:372 start_codon:yes stop_codon:yes gene_type:complete